MMNYNFTLGHFSLRVTTLNIRGGFHNKLHDVAKLLNDLNCEIGILTETKLWRDSFSQTVTNKTLRRLGFSAHFSSLSKRDEEARLRRENPEIEDPSPPARRGITFLIKENLSRCVTNFREWDRGQVASVDLQIETRKFRVIGTYAPNTPDPQFFNNLCQATADLQTNHIIAGDLNRRLLSTGRVSGEFSRNETMPSQRTVDRELHEFMQKRAMVDTFSLLHPNSHKASFISDSGISSSKIDFVLVQRSLAPLVSVAEVISNNFTINTDHRPVLAEMRCRDLNPQTMGETPTRKKPVPRTKGASEEKWRIWETEVHENLIGAEMNVFGPFAQLPLEQRFVEVPTVLETFNEVCQRTAKRVFGPTRTATGGAPFRTNLSTVQTKNDQTSEESSLSFCETKKRTQLTKEFNKTKES